jgi:quinolinate synthase
MMETYERLTSRAQSLLHGVIPDAEIRYKAELAYEINRLKDERDAIILGHNYMEPALYHLVCDIVGDSLELSRRAAGVERKIIVFCGVRFMAETANILNPTRTVLLPSERAGCSLAGSLTGADVRRLKEMYPGVPVVCYINTYADVKAECDICCTSGNASRIVDQLGTDSVVFVPDKYLAGNVARETGRTMIMAGEPLPAGRSLVAWDGKCEVHEQFTVKDVLDIRAQYPEAVILAHPECPPDVTAAADISGSTSVMVKYIATMKAKQFALLTECSMGDNIAAAHQDKELIRMCSIRCPHMNTITLEDTLESLRKVRYVIEVPEEIRNRARRSLDRMLELS